MKEQALFAKGSIKALRVLNNGRRSLAAFSLNDLERCCERCIIGGASSGCFGDCCRLALRSMAGVLPEWVRSDLGAGARSCSVNNLSGDGVAALTAQLFAFARSMRWYGEALPEPWMKLQNQLRARQVWHRSCSESIACRTSA